MFRKKSIAFRLSFYIILSTTLIFMGQFAYYTVVSRSIVIEGVEQSSETTLMSAIFRIESLLGSTENIALGMTSFIESGIHDQETVRNYLKSIVAKHENVYGSCIAFESFPINGTMQDFCPYYYQSGENLIYADLASGKYNYKKWEWYAFPKEKNQPHWSKPYFDEGGGNILMITYSMPFYKMVNGTRMFAGVITCDIPIKSIQDMLDAIKIYKTGYTVLAAEDGTIINHPVKDNIMNKTIQTLSNETSDITLQDIGKEMVEGKSDFIEYKSATTGKLGYLSYKYIPKVRWSLAMFFPEEEFLEENTNLGNTIMILGGIGFVLIFIVTILISNNITSPIKYVASTLELISNGNISESREKAREYLSKIIKKKKKNDLSEILSDSKKDKNELTRLYNTVISMAESLSILIGEVRSSGIKVRTSTTEIIASIREFEAIVVEQAASTIEVSSTSKEIKVTSENLADNMNEVLQSVENTSELAEVGRENLDKMEDELQNLIKATNSISSKLDLISNKADKISGVVTTINEISDQTNLLSLNAAIEAEKAEEYGKGFAVVAREISRLSDQTAIATKDIEYMVNEMHSAVSSGVMEMDRFGDQVRRSVKNTGKISYQLTNVIDKVNDLKPEFEFVNEIMQAQATGAAQIKEAMEQLSTTAENIRQSISEFSGASKQLNEAVATLQNEVLRFNVD
jgi:methyl-accepting chemotaxis protein